MNMRMFWAAMSRVLKTAVVVFTAIAILAGGSWAASKYKNLCTFQWERGATFPEGGLVFDSAGNLYGTIDNVVYELMHNADGTWTKYEIYRFGLYDGCCLRSTLIFDQSGNLYGTAPYGGPDLSLCIGEGCGVVFRLSPNGDGTWTNTLLHSFIGTDGYTPWAGVIFDSAGNLYGTTELGGDTYGSDCGYSEGCGTVYELTPNQDGTWTEKILHSFKNDGKDGVGPHAGLIFDQSGNLYGTTGGGGAYGNGTVFRLTPNSDGSWTKKTLHAFKNNGVDGGGPLGGVVLDKAGNVYGTTSGGGVYGFGTVFRLHPNQSGGWTERIMHSFKDSGIDGRTPVASLVFDAAGNLYGTTQFGLDYWGYGTIFRLKPNADGTWTYSRLHVFVNQPGANPVAAMIVDAEGNLYGTTVGDNGGATWGSVFEITP